MSWALGYLKDLSSTTCPPGDSNMQASLRTSALGALKLWSVSESSEKLDKNTKAQALSYSTGPGPL